MVEHDLSKIQRWKKNVGSPIWVCVNETKPFRFDILAVNLGGKVSNWTHVAHLSTERDSSSKQQLFLLVNLNKCLAGFCIFSFNKDGSQRNNNICLSERHFSCWENEG